MRGSLGTILALSLWLKKLSIILGDGASAASHDIGASNATENYEQFRQMLRGVLVTILAWETRLDIFNSSWRCFKGHWSQYWREKRHWKFFNNPREEVKWRNEVTSYSRYHAVFLPSLCKGREKMSSRSFSGKFSHRVRPETYYWHPCQWFKTKKKANSRKLTVPDGFVLRPRKPAYFTNDLGMKWQKCKFGRLVRKTTERFPLCSCGKRQLVSCVVQGCKPFCCGLRRLSSQAFQKRLQAKGLRRKTDSEKHWWGEPTKTERRFFLRLRRPFCDCLKACVHRNWIS